MNGEMIYSDRVRQARELKRLTQKQVADAVGVNQSTIARIEDGTTLSPLYDLLSAIARETDVTVEFFKREPVKPFPKGSLVYRARSRITLGEQNQAHQYAKLLVEQTQRMGKRLSLPALQLPICEDPAQAARLTRGVLGIAPLNSMPHLVNRLERHGIVVFGLPFRMEKVDAFSAWAEMDGERPFVALSGDCPGDRTRFSVAHELGHLVMHKGLDGRNQDLEGEANQFAAEFLLPEDAMRQILNQRLTLANVARLKSRWKVSIQMIVRRARDLGIITERRYRYLFMEIGKKGWRTSEPVDIPVEHPRLFRQMTERLYGAAKKDLGLAAALGITVDLAATLLKQYDSVLGTRRLAETEPYNIGSWEHIN